MNKYNTNKKEVIKFKKLKPITINVVVFIGGIINFFSIFRIIF